ncbi:MAG: hypothetical protein V1711_02655 [bacterium]
MKSRLTATVAIILTITIIAPSVFFIVPQRTYAQYSVFETNPALVGTQTTNTTINAIKSTLTEMHAYTSMVTGYAQYVNTYVLQPLAFVLSGNLLKAITAGVLAFVIGETNGTGAPQFVQNLQGHMQKVGDTQAFSFFAQFGKNSNSPFAASITSSLRNNYLQNTSLAGFFAANQCTLSKSSQNINAFLSGNWSQGGTRAWFALTTQNQNNPFTLYQASQGQLASVVGSAISARGAELSWGQGFLSWCGSDTSSGPVTVGSKSSPGDPCTNEDSTPGTIKTPGSTIKAALDKVLGADQDKWVQMGQVASEIGGILSDVGSVMGTASMAWNILGGANSGGLFGVGQSSGSGASSQLSQYRTSPGYLGVTQSTVAQNAANLPATDASISSRISQYESAWNTINAAANTASTSVAALASYCSSQTIVARDLLNSTYIGDSTAEGILTPFISASNAQANTARMAITTEIVPVFAKVSAASTIVATANAMVLKVQNEMNSAISGSSTAYVADMQTLQTMSPTPIEVSNALQDSQAFGTATASPAGSLTVFGDSLVDKMNLMSANANTLQASCDIPIIPSYSYGGG